MQLGIRTRLIAFSLLLCLGVGGLITAYATSLQRQALNEEFHETANSLSQLLATTLADPIYELRINEISRVLRAAATHRDLTSILVMDAEGYVLSDGSEANLLQDTFHEELKELLPHLSRTREPVYAHTDDGIEIYTAVRSSDDRLLGFVNLYLSLDRVGSLAEQSARKLIIVVLLGHRLVRPIRNMMVATRELSEGNFSTRVDRTSNDELGQLGESINRMAENLQHTTLSQHQLSDIVEQRTAALLIARDEAEQASRSKSAFLANMSHELRTPMHAIISFSALGQRKSSREDVNKLQGYFERISDSSQRLLGLLNNLLDLSKLEAGAFELSVAEEDLNTLVAVAIDEFEALVQERRLTLQHQHSPEAKNLAIVDGPRLLQVLRNLIGNAIKFSPQGGAITLSIQPTQMITADGAGAQAAVSISIRDQGLGIPESELETIFDKFEQSSLTRSNAGGTGLGLAICREIVELHGGRISLHNRRSGGIRAEVLLPQRLTQAAATE